MADQQPPPGFVPMAEPAPPLGFVLVNEAKKRGMDIFPNWLQDLAKYGPGFAKESGKILGRGAATLGTNLAEGAGNLAGEGMRSPNITNSSTPQQDVARALPDSLSDSPVDQRFRRTMEGTGAGLLLPVPGAGIVTSGLVGAGSGLGGAVGRQAAETFAPKSPGVQATGDILGSMFGGGLGALTFGPKQSVAQQDIRKALTGTTPAGYEQAATNARQSQAVGSTTATGAEMFPPNSGVVALGDKVRGSASDNPLRLQTTDRPGDLERMATEFLNRIKPQGAGPNTVATNVNQSADAISESLNSARSAAMNAPMKGVFVPPQELTGIINILKTSKALAQRQGAKDAYQVVIDEMTPGGKPIQDLSQLSLAITEAKPRNVLRDGAQEIGPNDMKQAIGHARDLLAQAVPEFKQGFEAYKSQSKNVVEPFKRSPLDKLTSTNPFDPREGRIGQVSQVFAGSNPKEVRGIASELAQAPGAPTNPLDIARALSEMKLEKGSTDPGKAIRGLQGSSADQKLQALLDVGGRDPAHVTAPLNAADNLQAYAEAAGLNPPTVMEKMQLLIRPLRTLDMMTTGRGINKTNAEIGRLLADRSPEGMRKLQEIGMFDPAVRRALTGRALLAPLDQEQ